MDLAQGLDRAYDVITGIHRHDDAAGSFLDKGLLGLFHSNHSRGAVFYFFQKHRAPPSRHSFSCDTMLF